MSNAKKRIEQARHQRRQRTVWLMAAAVVLAALIAAVVASTGGGDDEVVEGVEQVRDVEITGDALPEASPEGSTAPEVVGADFEGNRIAIEHGRPKLVLLLAHWCPHCQAEVPRIVDHLADTDLPEGVDLVAISTSVSEDRPNYPPSTWLAEERWDWPVVADDAESSAAGAFGLTSFPYLVGLDADGTVVGTLSGEFPMEQFDALAQAVAG